MNLTTHYLGLSLCNPLVASASPLNDDLGNLRALEDAGAAAVVLPSMFSEQIEAEDLRHERLSNVGALSSPEAASYFPAQPHHSSGAEQYLELIRSARHAIDIPVIASLNSASAAGWTQYATLVEQAGASAIELNIYFVASDISKSGREVEQRYVEIVRAVRQRVSIPVSVKLSPYFSSPAHLAAELVSVGADGLVLFNRFYQPDIDVVRLQVINDLDLSQSSEMRLPLLWLGVMHGRISASLAASTGVHGVSDVVKYLLAGADVVMTTSSLLQRGIGQMRYLVDGLNEWLDQRNIESVADIRGSLSQCRIANPEAYERANYIKILQDYKLPKAALGQGYRP